MAQKQRLSGWLYLPLITLLLVLGLRPVSEFRKARNVADEINTRNTPELSFNELNRERLQLMKTVFADGQPKDPVAYFEYARAIKTWSKKYEKFDYLHHYDRPTEAANLQKMKVSLHSHMASQKAAYDSAFGEDLMRQTANKYWKEHDPYANQGAPVDYAAFWSACRTMYWPAVVIWGFGILPLWLTRRGMKVWYEIPRIIPASLTFFGSWVIYPTRLDQTRQAKSALEFACNLLIAFFSLGVAGGSIAKAQTGVLRIKAKTEQVEKRKRHGTVTLTTGISSEMASGISGGIFTEHPSFQTNLRIAMNNGFYVFASQFMGLNDPDPSSDAGDWLLNGIGYTKAFGKYSIASEGSIMSAPAFSCLRGDYFVLRGTISKRLGKKGGSATLYGAVREVWKMTGKTADSGTYGYLGYNRGTNVLWVPTVMTTELKLDPGNIGKGAAVTGLVHANFSIPKVRKLRFLRPFVEFRRPLWKEKPQDPRSAELFGGFNFSFSFSF